jgi:hypothetical protein
MCDTPPCSNGFRVIVGNFQLGFGFSKVKVEVEKLSKDSGELGNPIAERRQRKR